MLQDPAGEGELQRLVQGIGIEGFDELRSVVSDAVYLGGDRANVESFHDDAVQDLIHLVGFGPLRVKPGVDAIVREDDRGPVVDLAGWPGCLGGDDDRGPQPPVEIVIGLGVLAPQFVEAGEGERFLTGRVDVEGLLGDLAVEFARCPFVVAASGNDHPASAESRSP